MQWDSSALLTDLYQLTMLEGYHRHGMHEPAVFECFVRRLPANRGYLVAAGLEQVLDYLEGLRFRPDELDWLRGTGHFGTAFLDWLSAFRFEGDVHALPEGTIFFDNEPILRIEASLTQAQLVESRVLNLLNFQTLIATKATRCRLSAPDAALVDFGMRRAHGAEAALFAARSSFLAGFSGTATVAAGRAYGIPTVGTMAHSFVQAHALEADAFRNFAEAQPENVVLLIDTYDTEAGARTAVELAAELAARNSPIKALRIDSGDLAVHARRVRDILDAGGHPEIGIFASGDLDEFALRDLTGQGAPVDGYGIGTRLDTSADAPYLNMVYKLQAYAGQATRKRSEGKSHWPAAKQVHREFDTGGLMLRDHLTLADEPADGTGLIAPVMRGGRRLAPSPGFDALRAFAGAERERLPAALRALDGRDYPVEVSDGLRDLAARLDRQSH